MRRIILTIIFSAVCLFTGVPALAQNSQSTDNCFKFNNTLFGNGVCAPDYLSKFYAWAVGIGIFSASIAIIWAGYRYTVSRGNPSEISSAKEIIVSALVGLALLLLSFTILRFLGVNVVSP